jgi:hypothetical protein
VTADLVALADQANAAHRDAVGRHVAICAAIGQDVNEPVPAAGVEIARQLKTLMESEQLVLCQHLALLAPGVAIWSPVLGELLACPPCFDQRMRRVRNRELMRCSGCRAPSPTGYEHSLVVPAVAVADGVLPPCVCVYRLCVRCEHRGGSDEY